MGPKDQKLATALRQGRRCPLIRLYDIPLRLYEITGMIFFYVCMMRIKGTTSDTVATAASKLQFD